MNSSSSEAVQREEFFKKSFRGTFSYNVKVSSVNSFLRSMAQRNMSSEMEDHQSGINEVDQSAGSSKDTSIH